MIIADLLEKIKGMAPKPQKRDLGSFIVIILVATGSFYLGQNNATKNNNSQVQVVGGREVVFEKNPQTNSAIITGHTANLNQNTLDENTYTKGNYLASSRGKKYYPVDCPASGNIKEANRIYFKTAQDAESRGYTLSSSCN